MDDIFLSARDVDGDVLQFADNQCNIIQIVNGDGFFLCANGCRNVHMFCGLFSLQIGMRSTIFGYL